MNPLTARDIMHPDLLDENGQLLEKSSLLERSTVAKFDAAAFKAAIAKLRDRSYVVPMGQGLPGHPPYTGCMWWSGGRYCSNMATHRAKETCEHEHVFVVFTCTEHKDSQSQGCSQCQLLLGDKAHACQTKLREVKELDHG